MNARQLEVFRAIMRTGSITDAAHFLNVSQPTVSKIIRHAESQHGIRLFQTVRGRITPTPEAELLYPHADRVFRDLSGLRALSERLRSGGDGLVRVVASSSLSSTLVAQAIAAFRTIHPHTQFVAHVLPALDAVEKARAHQVDFAMTLSPVITASLRVRTLGHVEMAAVMPYDHPMAMLDRVRPTDISAHTFVTFGSDSHFGVLLDEAFERCDVSRKIDVQVFSSQAAASLVAQGAGVTVIDRLGALAFAGGMAVRPFTPAIRVPVSLIQSDTQPYAKLCHDFGVQIERMSGPILSELRASHSMPISSRILSHHP